MEKECMVKNIMVVKINFCLLLSVCLNLILIWVGDKIEFIDIKVVLEGKEFEKGGDGDIVDDLMV